MFESRSQRTAHPIWMGQHPERGMQEDRHLVLRKSGRDRYLDIGRTEYGVYGKVLIFERLPKTGGMLENSDPMRS
jgi:hypothetical protein